MLTAKEIDKIVEDYSKESVQCLVDALRSPSPTGEEAPMAETMLRWIDKIQLKCQTFEYMENRPNILAEWIGDEDGKHFLFNGHLDVFPAAETDDPSYDPWSGDIKDGFIYGRGASDMKSGDCAALMAIKLLKESGFVPKGKVTLSYVSDEENGGTYGILSMLKENLIDADFGISMEPSDLGVLLHHGGLYPCQIVVYGDGGYAGVPMKETRYGGEDAIKKAMKAIQALYDLSSNIIDKKPITEVGRSHLAVTKIQAGQVVNNYPRRAHIIIDRRYLSGETPESVDAEIIGAMEAVKKKDPTFEYDYIPCYEPDTPVFDVPDNCEIVRLIDASFEDLFGRKPDHVTGMGGADVAYIRRETGADLPWFGPGSLHNGLATTEERVLIQDYLNCIKVYMLTIVKALS